MNKTWVMLVLGAAVILLLLTAASPPPPSGHEAPVSAHERARNAALLTALSAAGIERAWVDAGAQRVLAVYALPPGLSRDTAQAYVLGAAAVVSPTAEELISQTTDGSIWRARGADVRAYQEGTLPLDALLNGVEREG